MAIVGMSVLKSPLLMALLILASPAVVVCIVAAVSFGAIRKWWAYAENAAKLIGNAVQAEADKFPDTGIMELSVANLG
jgi:hypothetical protein